MRVSWRGVTLTLTLKTHGWKLKLIEGKLSEPKPNFWSSMTVSFRDGISKNSGYFTPYTVNKSKTGTQIKNEVGKQNRFCFQHKQVSGIFFGRSGCQPHHCSLEHPWPSYHVPSIDLQHLSKPYEILFVGSNRSSLGCSPIPGCNGDHQTSLKLEGLGIPMNLHCGKGSIPNHPDEAGVLS